MKRYGSLLALLVLGVTFLTAQPYAQNLFISEYLEGSSNNKAVEIFNGTGAAVDLSQYTLKLASNGGTWSTTNFHNPTGTLAHGDVYVVANSQANATILGVADATSTVTYFNGDDCVGLFQGDTLIDIIGVYQTDPGTAWPVAGVTDATLNHTLIRKPTITQGNTDWLDAAGTNSDDSEWMVEASDFVTDLGMHTFTPSGGDNVAMPVFNPGGGIYTSPVSVTITCSTPNSSIFYTTDGSTPTPTSTPYTAPLTIGGTTTLKAMATAPGLNNSSVATAVYNFPQQVANLAALRAMPTGPTVYYLPGEVVLTFQQSNRHQKYVQDASAAIVIDDPAGIITSTYNLGDGISGLTGTLGAYSNLLQFTPVQDPGPASSNGNTVNPELRTFASLTPDDQAQLIRVLNVTIDPTQVTFPATAANINATDPTATLTLRTFPNAEYSNTPIPTAAVHLVCLVGQYQDTMQVSPRFLADFESTTGVAAPVFDPPAGDFVQPFSLSMSCATPNTDIYYTLDGSEPDDGSTLYTNPITISATTTVRAVALLDATFSPVTTAVYSFPADVGSLADLRQAPLNALYRVNAEIVVSFTQDFRNQIFAQDGSAGILIDDPDNVITTAYSKGDGMENLTGNLNEFGGMLQFVPVLDPGPPSSTLNDIVPLEITLAQFNAGFETYEARVVKLMDVVFFNPSGNFANGQVYPIEDLSGDHTANFRATFYDVSYIDHPVYPDEVNLTGIPNSRTEGNFITARDWWDFQLSEVKAPWLDLMYLPEHPETVYISAIFEWFMTVPDGLTGYRLYRNGVLLMEHGPDLTADWTDQPGPGSWEYHATAMFGATESGPSNTCTHIITATPENPPAAPETALLGNYPNPFNPSTSIALALKQAGPVRIDIFNPRGQLLKTLVDAELPDGQHVLAWDGRDQAGHPLGSGLYLCRMQSGSYSGTLKMLMLK